MPILYEDLLPYWEAFVTLAPARGMSGAIPLREILDYCELYGISDKQDFCEYVRMIDREYSVAQAKYRKLRSEDK